MKLLKEFSLPFFFPLPFLPSAVCSSALCRTTFLASVEVQVSQASRKAPQRHTSFYIVLITISVLKVKYLGDRFLQFLMSSSLFAKPLKSRKILVEDFVISAKKFRLHGLRLRQQKVTNTFWWSLVQGGKMKHFCIPCAKKSSDSLSET